MTKQSVKVYYKELFKKKNQEEREELKKKKYIYTHVKFEGQPSVLPAVRGDQDDMSQ